MRVRSSLAVAAATVALSTVATAVPAEAHVTTCATVGPVVVTKGRFEANLLGVCAEGSLQIRLHGRVSGACGTAVGFGVANDGVSSHRFDLLGSDGLVWTLTGEVDGALSLVLQGTCVESGTTTFASHGSLTFV